MECKCCINCGRKHMGGNQGQDGLRKAAKSMACFLCATCLCAQVGAAELDFGKVALHDHAANDFSKQSIDLIFSSTNSTLTLSALPGDLMIDFAHIHSVSHPDSAMHIFVAAEGSDIVDQNPK